MIEALGNRQWAMGNGLYVLVSFLLPWPKIPSLLFPLSQRKKVRRRGEGDKIFDDEDEFPINL
jgi:hypothetical protein